MIEKGNKHRTRIFTKKFVTARSYVTPDRRRRSYDTTRRDELFHSRISHKIRVSRGWRRVFNNAEHRMFVASYRASMGGGDGGKRKGGRKSWSRVGEIQQRKGFAVGGGDGIDQVKYFTTHFRRCTRRVVWGWGRFGRLKGQQKKKHSTILRDRNIPPFPYSLLVG